MVEMQVASVIIWNGNSSSRNVSQGEWCLLPVFVFTYSASQASVECHLQTFNTLLPARLSLLWSADKIEMTDMPLEE